ncbi:MAG: hypothetical protein L3K08_02190 [Thermoplasmata archaeon]|nr:hypothetical protein [Thermoplasmata archaeon]
MPLELPEDPLTWIIQNAHAATVLEELRSGEEREPLETRKATALDAETFRRVVRTLTMYDVVEIHARKGSKVERSPKGWGFRVGIQLTPRGLQLLETLDAMRQVVRDRANKLPEATRSRWLEA